MKVIFSLFCLFIIQIYAAPNIARPVVPSDVRSGNDAVVVSENSKPRSQPQPAPKLSGGHKALSVEEHLVSDPKQNQLDSDQIKLGSQLPVQVDAQENVIQKSEPEQRVVVVVEQTEEHITQKKEPKEEPKPIVEQIVVENVDQKKVEEIAKVEQKQDQVLVLVQEEAKPVAPVVEPVVPIVAIVPEVPVAPIEQIAPIVAPVVPIVPVPKSVSIDRPQEQQIKSEPVLQFLETKEVSVEEQTKKVEDVSHRNDAEQQRHDSKQTPDDKVVSEPVVESRGQEEKKEEKVVEVVERKGQEETKLPEQQVDVKKDGVPELSDDLKKPELNIAELPKDVPRVEEPKPVVVVEEKQPEQPIVPKVEPIVEPKPVIESEQSQKDTDLQKQQPL